MLHMDGDCEDLEADDAATYVRHYQENVRRLEQDRWSVGTPGHVHEVDMDLVVKDDDNTSKGSKSSRNLGTIWRQWEMRKQWIRSLELCKTAHSLGLSLAVFIVQW